MLKTHDDKARLELSVKGKLTRLYDVLKLYLTISYTEDDDKKKIEEDIFLNFINFIESLHYSEDIAELDVIENFNDRRKSRWFLKKSYRLRILFHFVQDPDI